MKSSSQVSTDAGNNEDAVNEDASAFRREPAAFLATLLVDYPIRRLDGSDGILPQGSRVVVMQTAPHLITDGECNTHFTEGGDFIATADGDVWIGVIPGEFSIDS